MSDDMQINPGASQAEVAQLACVLGQSPDHFWLSSVLARADGLEGFIDPDRYIRLWRANEIVELNSRYEVEKFAPGLVLVGSNGGGEAFAAVKTDLEPHLLMVPFVPLDRHEALWASDTLRLVLKLLQHQEEGA